MKIYYVCQQKFEEDGKTKMGDIKYLTIDGGWTSFEEFAAIFRKCHAKYLTEKHRKAIRDYCAGFSIKEIKNA